MRYPIECPRCGGNVLRHDLENAFPLGSFFKNAFGPHKCEKCGTIPDSEFSSEIQREIKKDRIIFFVAPFVLIAIIFWFMSLME